MEISFLYWKNIEPWHQRKTELNRELCLVLHLVVAIAAKPSHVLKWAVGLVRLCCIWVQDSMIKEKLCYCYFKSHCQPSNMSSLSCWCAQTQALMPCYLSLRMVPDYSTDLQVAVVWQCMQQWANGGNVRIEEDSNSVHKDINNAGFKTLERICFANVVEEQNELNMKSVACCLQPKLHQAPLKSRAVLLWFKLFFVA